VTLSCGQGLQTLVVALLVRWMKEHGKPLIAVVAHGTRELQIADFLSINRIFHRIGEVKYTVFLIWPLFV